MNIDSRKKTNTYSAMINTIAAEKKKCTLAVCLIVLMAFMWVRVLTGKTPQNAAAQQPINTTNTTKTEQQPQITFIELPDIPGRHNMLKKDFFTLAETKVLHDENNPKNENTLQNNISQLARIEAIVVGDNPQAFINDKLYSENSEFVLTDGSEIYRCKIVSIEESYVLIECRKKQIIMKLKNQ